MEKIYDTTLVDLLENEFVLIEIIGFLDISTLFTKFFALNKRTKELIENENYGLFQKYRDFINVPATFNSSDIPAKKSMLDMFK